ncbi:hypothetical protein HMPREF0591_4074 [Mycobacterium parascrofulaceum ATCC BAA-614]|uniref:Uncharacterized protein n=1 Tax=Mycobacterium parascrofulaceum ATCC BAA-614 TaxID=525368 RepID=D5PD30_9MYCO|nr:hypothetical protein HMPREF0591_4074 [Mycobacterium parascrofulaceum ATCC BAA-614]
MARRTRANVEDNVNQLTGLTHWSRHSQVETPLSGRGEYSTPCIGEQPAAVTYLITRSPHLVGASSASRARRSRAT